METPCCKICLEFTSQYIQTIGLGADLSPGRLVYSERYIQKVLQALRIKSCQANFITSVRFKWSTSLYCSSSLLTYLYLEPTSYFISSHFTFLKYLFASLIANISANLPLYMCFYISYDRGPYVQWEFGVLRDPTSSSCGGLKPFYPIMLFLEIFESQSIYFYISLYILGVYIF